MTVVSVLAKNRPRLLKQLLLHVREALIEGQKIVRQFQREDLPVLVHELDSFKEISRGLPRQHVDEKPERKSEVDYIV